MSERQALLWDREERSPDLLLRGEALHDAEAWAKGREHSLPDYEMEFLAASQIADQAANQREQRRTRLIATLAAVAVLVAGVALALLYYGQVQSSQKDKLAAEQSLLMVEQSQLEAEQMTREVPEFGPGDTVSVKVKVVCGTPPRA